MHFITLLFLLSCHFAWASFDLSMGAQFRSRPMIGGEVYAESGKNILLWGEKTPESKDILYGLIRPNFGISSSGVINSYKGEIELFPISMLGFVVGRQYQHSNFEFPFFNCDEVACRGEYQRNYVETRLALGAKGVVLVSSYRLDSIKAPHGRLPIADWRHVIIGANSKEIQREAKALLAYNSGKWLTGILAEHVGFEKSRQVKEAFTLVAQYRPKEVAYMVGMGSFRTDHVAQGLIFYFRMHYQAIPSLKLF